MEKQAQYLEAYEKYSDALYRHCYFRLSDRERALDLVQETYLKAWQYIEDGQEIIAFKAFLYKILNNLIIDEYRRKKSVSLDALLEEGDMIEGEILELRDDVSGASMGISVDIERIQESLAALPEPYREAVTLRYIDGLSPHEIGELIEESENVVSVRIHRGIKKLREFFETASKESLRNARI